MSLPTFDRIVREKWEEWRDEVLSKARGEDMIRTGRLYDAKGGYTEAELGYPYFRRMGWQTKNKAFIGEDNRIILPLYSDGFSFSLMALTDDGGQTWQFSNPLVGAGNIQPSLVQGGKGTLVAYMRDNGPAPKRLHISRSRDNGLTWSDVQDSQIPNPGAGADLVTLSNGHWVLAFNDTERGRHSLAVSTTRDEGQIWSKPRHLEQDPKKTTSFAYPAIVQAKDGALHVVYSYHGRKDNGEAHKTIKHARFNEAWILDQQ